MTHQPRIGTDAEWVADGFSRDETLVLALGPDALPRRKWITFVGADRESE